MTQSAQTLTVLAVDDSAVYRKHIEHTLEGHPYDLLFAKSGSEALELFNEHQPAIVLTDWLTPDLSGLELCQKIRTAAPDRYTYVILLTGVSEKGSVVKGLDAGADDYLTKPFDPAELLARIGVGQRLVGLHREIEIKNRLLEEAARTDSLTTLPNRRAIEEWGDRQIRGAARHGFPLWVVLADLDSFKSVNDTYGHAAGDTVLRKFAEHLKCCTRASDIAGRLGGDEFVLVMTHVAKADIVLTIERLREDTADLGFDFCGGGRCVTASFGIAGFQSPTALEFEKLLRAADEALYAAKRSGRNRVHVASL
jgi:two-component system chemotaxis response regulator CheY